MNDIQASMYRIKASLTVVKDNRTLLWYPIFSIVMTFILLATGIWAFVVGSNISAEAARHTAQVASLVIAFLIINLVGTISSAAFFLSATQALEGERTSFKKGFQKAWEKRKYLLQWALFSTGVFFLIFLVQSGLDRLMGPFSKGIGRFLTPVIGSLLSLGWAFASFFAIPVLLAHPDTPLPTLKRSLDLFKRTWGENVTASVSFGLLGMVLGMLTLTLAGMVVMAINYGIFRVNPDVPGFVFGIVYAAVALPSIMTLTIVLSAVQSIFAASLYRYAETGDYVGPYSKEMIEGAFKPRKKLFRTR